jgi:hypothetical protein
MYYQSKLFLNKKKKKKKKERERDIRVGRVGVPMQVFIFFYDLIVFLERRFTFFYFFSSKKCTRGIYGLSCRSCPTLTVSLG